MRLCLAVILSLISLFNPAHARPLFGQIDWWVLYCRFTDSPPPARTITDFNDMVTGNTVYSSFDGFGFFFDKASHQTISQVFHTTSSWVTMPRDLVWARSLDNSDRLSLLSECVAAEAAAGTTVPPGANIVVVTTPGIQTFGGTVVGVEATPSNLFHEMGHGLGLNHSFSDRADRSAALGDTFIEYGDPFDVMSWNTNVFSTNGHWGQTGPRLNAFNLDRMGWVARDETINFGADGKTLATYTLTPLYQSAPGGIRLIRIPFDPDDPFDYYAVEMRKMEELDAGIAMHRVLIYEVRTLPGFGYLASFLLRVDSNKDAIQSLNANGVTITINSIAADGNSAVVTITGDIAMKCIPGYVQRKADPKDEVCVLPASFTAAQTENKRSKIGSKRCPKNLVPRNAVPNDFVCVTISRFKEVQAENASAADHNAAGAFRGVNQCIAGYVWRQATSHDYVCVSPQTYAETQEENQLALSRKVPLPYTRGAYLCAAGFTRRNAVRFDGVCAPDSSHLRAIQDNAQAAVRLAHP